MKNKTSKFNRINDLREILAFCNGHKRNANLLREHVMNTRKTITQKLLLVILLLSLLNANPAVQAQETQQLASDKLDEFLGYLPSRETGSPIAGIPSLDRQVGQGHEKSVLVCGDK